MTHPRPLAQPPHHPRPFLQPNRSAAFTNIHTPHSPLRYNTTTSSLVHQATLPKNAAWAIPNPHPQMRTHPSPTDSQTFCRHQTCTPPRQPDDPRISTCPSDPADATPLNRQPTIELSSTTHPGELLTTTIPNPFLDHSTLPFESHHLRNRLNPLRLYSDPEQQIQYTPRSPHSSPILVPHGDGSSPNISARRMMRSVIDSSLSVPSATGSPPLVPLLHLSKLRSPEQYCDSTPTKLGDISSPTSSAMSSNDSSTENNFHSSQTNHNIHEGLKRRESSDVYIANYESHDAHHSLPIDSIGSSSLLDITYKSNGFVLSSVRPGDSVAGQSDSPDGTSHQSAGARVSQPQTQRKAHRRQNRDRSLRREQNRPQTNARLNRSLIESQLRANATYEHRVSRREELKMLKELVTAEHSRNNITRTTSSISSLSIGQKQANQEMFIKIIRQDKDKVWGEDHQRPHVPSDCNAAQPRLFYCYSFADNKIKLRKMTRKPRNLKGLTPNRLSSQLRMGLQTSALDASRGGNDRIAKVLALRLSHIQSLKDGKNHHNAHTPHASTLAQHKSKLAPARQIVETKGLLHLSLNPFKQNKLMEGTSQNRTIPGPCSASNEHMQIYENYSQDVDDVDWLCDATSKRSPLNTMPTLNYGDHFQMSVKTTQDRSSVHKNDRCFFGMSSELSPAHFPSLGETHLCHTIHTHASQTTSTLHSAPKSQSLSLRRRRSLAASAYREAVRAGGTLVRAKKALETGCEKRSSTERDLSVSRQTEMLKKLEVKMREIIAAFPSKDGTPHFLSLTEHNRAREDITHCTFRPNSKYL
eukprot:GHVN01106239.1.p1 GENE.GHVN01106239.1~~GHVN01106239.1.p1  ORF type:complete len:812 (-),score=78.09 GHVN01106239.1:1831-4266(-)